VFPTDAGRCANPFNDAQAGKTHDMDVTGILATFAADPRYDEPSAEVRHAARRCLLDFIGVAAAGARQPAVAMAIASARRLGAAGDCAIIGSSWRADAFNAAMINGVAAHVLDWDDTILPARVHLCAALLPPLFAAGEMEGWRLADILACLAIGFEIQARLSRAIYPSLHERKWHSTTIVAATGVAAAVGRRLGCDAEQLRHAMGIAANSAAGLMSSFGTMSKALNIGRAGALGLQSAYLAASGYRSHADTIGAGSFLERYDEKPRTALLIKDLGSTWLILEDGFKLYPCGVVSHAAIDAACLMRARSRERPDLRAMHLRVSPEALELMSNQSPRNELEAKFSLSYVVAAAWVAGVVTPSTFENVAIVDPRIRLAMSRIVLSPSRDVAQDEAYLEAEFVDGARDALHIAHARGTQARPLTDQELAAKFSAALAYAGMDGNVLSQPIFNGADIEAKAFLAPLAHDRKAH
jgi:2-methylcitrate dehydratase PrpD